jgi:hypothetical protein
VPGVRGPRVPAPATNVKGHMKSAMLAFLIEEFKFMMIAISKASDLWCQRTIKQSNKQTNNLIFVSTEMLDW